MNILLLFVLIVIILYIIGSKKKSIEIKKENNTESKIVDKNKVKENFDITENRILNKVKYQDQYKDLIEVIKNIVPNQFDYFSIYDSRTTTISNTEKPIVNCIVNNFVKLLNKSNKIVKIDENTNSGWNKFRKNLGLADSIYESFKKANINLIRIDKVIRMENSKYIKYVLYLVLQKDNVDDQIVIMPSFILDKNIMNEPIIESIDIIGFLSKEKKEDYDQDLPKDSLGLTDQMAIFNMAKNYKL